MDGSARLRRTPARLGPDPASIRSDRKRLCQLVLRPCAVAADNVVFLTIALLPGTPAAQGAGAAASSRRLLAPALLLLNALQELRYILEPDVA